MVRSRALDDLLSMATSSESSRTRDPATQSHHHQQPLFDRSSSDVNRVLKNMSVDDDSSPLPTRPPQAVSLLSSLVIGNNATPPPPPPPVESLHRQLTAAAVAPTYTCASNQHDGFQSRNPPSSGGPVATMMMRPCALCQQLVANEAFISHLDSCPANVQSCLHCFAAVMVSQHDEHVMMCPKNARSCYICGKPVQLSSLAQHLQSCSVGKSLKMFHGTSLANAKSIMKTGFRPSVKGLLGEGVYLTKDVHKAQAYGPIIIESEVCLGRVAVINKKGHHLQRCWAAHGYDSAWIPPQCGVVASGLEEHCVRDARRIAPLRFFTAVDQASAN